MQDVRLSIRNLGKSYNVPVLKDVDLAVSRGEIRALVGENGAGKSTLVNILTGLVPRDRGETLLDGETYEPASAADGFAAGISFMSQELSIIESLTVAENIFLRDLPGRNAVIKKSALDASARRLLEHVGLDHIASHVSAASLSLAQRQLVEFAKAINDDCRVLLLDEPTAALTDQQAERVHAVTRELAASGVAVIYISHRLDDVLEIADTVTVLRDGAVVSTADSASVTTSDLVALMSGGETSQQNSKSAATVESRPALVIKNLCTAKLPHPIGMTCHAGEILGIAGLAGAGKSELLQAMFRLDKLVSGRVVRHVGDETIEIQNARHAVRNGIGFLGEDRRAMGVFPGQSVVSNMMLPDLLRPAARRIDAAAEKSAGRQLTERLAIRHDNLQQDVLELSGGNQQKVLIARWLNAGSAVMLLDEPTRGVDVSTKQSIYELLFELRSKGRCLIVASSETDELMALCDRILVLSNRRPVAEFGRKQWSEEAILSASFSAYTDAARQNLLQTDSAQ